MKVVRTVPELRELLAAEREARAGPAQVGLVPTMGFFHEGHLTLMRRARAQCDVVVVSLFVNPTQFAPSEDLATYPRDEERDIRLANSEGVDYLFAPPAEQVYPPGFATTVRVGGGLTEVLCGAPERRGSAHFDGVTTVVTKLFTMVGPDVAYFGQKDAQQSLIIRKLVRDLDLPVDIETCPTLREPDGLAMSSRNAYLATADRERARALSGALGAAEQAVAGGERAADAVLAAARAALEAAEVEPEYLELRSMPDLALVDRLEAPAVLAIAAWIGPARLIDNTILTPSEAA